MEPLLDLNSVRIFIAVVNLNSFSAAASQLGVTKSTVSRAITYLEEYTQSQLFYRTTRKLELTSSGQALYASCRDGFAALDSGLKSSLDMSRQLKGLIRITSVEDIGVALVVPAVAKFTDLYPQVRVDMHFTLDVMDLVQHSIDVAVRVGSTSQLTHRIRKVGQIAFILVASPKYLERFREPPAPADLMTADMIVMQSRKIEHSGITLLKNKEKKILKVLPKFQVESTAAILELAAAGKGIALLPDFTCEDALKKGTLERVCKGWHTAVRDISVVSPSHRKKSPMLDLFTQFLADYLSDRLA